MVDRIAGGGGLAREALLAAMRSQAESARGVEDAARAIARQATGADEASGPEGFGERLAGELRALDGEVEGVDRIPEKLLTGDLQDFHEVALQIKQAEFRFRFAMEIRNKLLDAYREVMRMNV